MNGDTDRPATTNVFLYRVTGMYGRRLLDTFQIHTPLATLSEAVRARNAWHSDGATNLQIWKWSNEDNAYMLIG